LAGFLIAYRKGVLTLINTLYVLFYTVFWLCLWEIKVGFTGPQYTLHILPLLIVGGSALGIISFRKPVLTYLLLFILAIAFLVAPFSERRVGFTQQFIGSGIAPKQSHKADFASYHDLILKVREWGGEDQVISVVASSDKLSDAIIKSLHESTRKNGDSKLNVLHYNDIDSRDSFPVADLMLSDLVVVATPAQIHLSEESQHFVSSIVASFLSEKNHFNKAFTRDNTIIDFPAGNFSVTFFKRTRPSTVSEGIELLNYISLKLPYRVISLKDKWTNISALSKAKSGANEDGSSWLYFESLSGKPCDADIVSTLPLVGDVQLHAKYRGKNGVIKLFATDANSRLRDLGQFNVMEKPDNQYNEIQLDGINLHNEQILIKFQAADKLICNGYFKSIRADVNGR
jgi:hypothetical protein